MRAELAGLLALANDAADPAAADALAAALRDAFGSLDGAFLNAGMGRFQPLSELTSEGIDEQFAVNVRGPILQAKALAPLLVDDGSLVLNTSSGPQQGAARCGGLWLHQGCVAHLGAGVGGRVGRPRHPCQRRQSGTGRDGFFGRSGMPPAVLAQFGQAIQAQVPLGRFGRPDEVANVAAFLLSDLASFVTGSEYVVDGGMSETSGLCRSAHRGRPLHAFGGQLPTLAPFALAGWSACRIRCRAFRERILVRAIRRRCWRWAC